MARRLRALKVPYELLIADNGVTHAFLNMKNLTYETQDAHDEVVSVISAAIREFEPSMNEVK